MAKLVFMGKIRKAQREFINVIKDDSKVLIIGGGTGWILEDIMKTATPSITYIEASIKMVARAEKRKYPNGQIEFINEAYTGQNLGEFDFIMTPFFLDLFEGEDLKKMMYSINNALKTNGYWLFTDFNQEIELQKRSWKRKLLRILFWFFRSTCNITSKQLGDFGSIFNQLGMQRTGRKYFFSKMIEASCYQKGV